MFAEAEDVAAAQEQAAPPPRVPAIDEGCHTCRYGGVYECKRHAPIAREDGKAVFPDIYNQGCGIWCGDYEPKDS